MEQVKADAFPVSVVAGFTAGWLIESPCIFALTLPLHIKSASLKKKTALVTSTPYANLTPILILDAIESIGYRCSGSLLALNSYENRVYQIGIEDEAPLIAKFYRPQRWSDEAILEEHAFLAELAQAEIPIVAPLARENGETLHHYDGYRFALFPRQSGRALELENVEQLEWIGRFLGRLHALGATQTFQHRMQLTTESYGYEPYRFLIENNFIPIELKQQYIDTVEPLLKKIEDCFLQAGDVKYIRIHGDCHAGNVLWNDTGPCIVDLDDCMMGPAVQDMWMLLSGNTQIESKWQLNHILDGYNEFFDFNWREIKLINALRALRMIMYAGWLAKRWEDPAFPLSFPWFNTMRYWQEQLQSLTDQADLLQEESEI